MIALELLKRIVDSLRILKTYIAPLRESSQTATFKIGPLVVDIIKMSYLNAETQRC